MEESIFETVSIQGYSKWLSGFYKLVIHSTLEIGVYVKDQVYVPPLPASIPEMKVQIRAAIETITADNLQTVWNELDYRVDVCRITKGAHIEQL